MPQPKKKDILLVLIQFVLLCGYGIVFFLTPQNTPIWMAFTGLILSIAGIVFALVAMRTLSSNLRAVPTPAAKGRLITHGVFKIVRHPIYSGIILTATGGLCIHFSVALLCLALGLIVLFWIKSSYEEQMLLEKYGEYKSYTLTTGKLFPKFHK